MDVMTEEEEMAERLRRAMQGRTQASLADAIGVATSTVNGYLKGKMPPADVALGICRELGIELEWYLHGTTATAVADGDEGVVQVPFVEDPRQALAYPAGLLGVLGYPLESLCCHLAAGNLMAPTIPQGTELLLTREVGQVVDGRVYLMSWGAAWAARRVRVAPGGRLLAVCDNPSGSPAEGDEVNRSDIAALALWAGHAV
jgi:transcriptional regulator with XRE-family HTH domain